ncbi:hypothetical protein BJN34_09745 [Cupriavidus necator]|uniref:Uncharacterized protein n=1 Tax=Cupriavidus necator TaxID=106590 RepID=A0A1U9UNJ4_CUPNE|nr:hypothetical protein [Cupriavidus necator]AQV94170.1 hypothetical protein BJN34_09745 [Cupriavidus necator]
MLSLAGAGLKALHAVHLPLDPDLIKGVLILPVVPLMLRATRRSKHGGQKGATRGPAANQAA